MTSPISNRLSDVLGSTLSRRRAIGKAAGVGITAAIAGAAISSPSSVSANQLGVLVTDATPVTGGSPLTVVLVHGAFADGSSWNNVIPLLQAAGIPTIAPANPLRGIASDAAYLDSVLAAIPGPVLLVGHSYGGAVISAASTASGQIAGLVYVAAFALDEGETGLQVLGQFPPTLLGPALRPATADPANPDLLIDPAQFHEAFAADLPVETTTVMAITQRPVLGSAFAEPAPVPAWKSLPSWFVVATGDTALGAEALRFFAKRAGSTTVEVDASHVVMLSQPQAVVDVITTAIGAVS